MARESSLALDVNGDLARPGGSFTRVTGVDYLVQKVRSRLLFFLGECFLDVDGVGIPYFQQILGVKQSNLPAVRSLFLKEILNTQGIATVDELQIALDHSTRRLRVVYRATGDLGELLSDSFEGPIQ
jgi:hypothetical protein